MNDNVQMFFWVDASHLHFSSKFCFVRLRLFPPMYLQHVVIATLPTVHSTLPSLPHCQHNNTRAHAASLFCVLLCCVESETVYVFGRKESLWFRLHMLWCVMCYQWCTICTVEYVKRTLKPRKFRTVTTTTTLDGHRTQRFIRHFI